MADRQGVNFEKWVAAGNSFIVVDGDSVKNDERSRFAIKVTDSENYIQADGVLFVSVIDDDLIRCDVYNKDGSIGEVSLNGFRIASAYCFSNSKRVGWKWSSLSLDKWISSQVSDRWQIENISSEDGLFSVSLKQEGLDNYHCEKINVDVLSGWSVFGVGNPHFVIPLDQEYQLEESHYENVFKKVSSNENFPFGVNVHFLKRVNQLGDYLIQTYERGVGRTLSCGSGSLASSICVNNEIDKDIEHIKTKSEGGILEVVFGEDFVICKGPAIKTLSGCVENF